MQGSIIKCQFSTNQKKDMHFHRDIEIIYMLKGSMEVECNGVTVYIGEEQFFLINTNEKHSCHSTEKLLAGSILIDYEMLSQMFQGKVMYFSCNSVIGEERVCDKMRHYIRNIFNYYHSADGLAVLIKDSYCCQLLYLLCTEFIIQSRGNRGQQMKSGADDRIEKIMQFLYQHYSEKVTLSTLAKQFYMSETYLSRFIVKNTGDSLVTLLNNIRLEHTVSDLISTDKTIVQTAIDNGFSSLAWFNSLFKEKYQMTPSEYRKEQFVSVETDQEKQESEHKIKQMVEKYLLDDLTFENEDDMFLNLEVSVHSDEKLVNNWNDIINIGDAAELLRYDVREQILILKKKLKFRHVGIFNLSSHQMMFEWEDNKVEYSFREIDKVFDFLINNEMYPLIIFGHQEKWFSGNIRQKVEIDERERDPYIENGGEVLADLVKHWVERYGEDNVSNWYVEVERQNRNLKDYFEQFKVIWSVFKEYVPEIKVGGMGFVVDFLGDEFQKMLLSWKNEDISPDMLTVYCFPYTVDADGRNRIKYSSNMDYMYNQLEKIRKTLSSIRFPERQIFVTRWGNTLSNRNRLNDSVFKGAYIMKNCIDSIGLVDHMGYCCALDLVSENYDTHEILFGGNGLLTKDGLYKPSYYAMRFLSRAKEYLLDKSRNALITYDGNKLIHICCHNYKHYNYRYYEQDEEKIDVNKQMQFFSDNERLKIRFTLKDVPNASYVIRKEYVNQKTGSIQEEWRKLGYYSRLKSEDIEYLRSGTHPGLHIESITVTDGKLVFETVLEAQEIQEISIQCLKS